MEHDLDILFKKAWMALTVFRMVFTKRYIPEVHVQYTDRRWHYQLLRYQKMFDGIELSLFDSKFCTHKPLLGRTTETYFLDYFINSRLVVIDNRVKPGLKVECTSLFQSMTKVIPFTTTIEKYPAISLFAHDMVLFSKKQDTRIIMG